MKSELSSSMSSLKETVMMPAGLSDTPLNFRWGGPEAHLAPTKVTPLSKALHNKTGSALFVLCAGVLVWAAKRFEQHADVMPALANAEALFCYQADARYFNLDGPSHLKSKLPLAREVIETLCKKASPIFLATPGEHSARPPITAVENVVSITRHVLGPEWRDPFRHWIETTIGRFDRLAANPRDEFLTIGDFDEEDDFYDYVRRNVGHPFPPSVLNDAPDRSADEYVREFAAYLPTVDWKSNPYLSPPKVMVAKGAATPYSYFVS